MSDFRKDNGAVVVQVNVSAKQILSKKVKVTGNQCAITFSKEETSILRLRKGQILVLGIIEIREEFVSPPTMEKCDKQHFTDDRNLSQPCTNLSQGGTL